MMFCNPTGVVIKCFKFFVGYIRVGSRVWGKALNGDFYKGVVTGLGQMVHIKFDNGDTIAHDRNDQECVVFDVDPDPKEIEIGISSCLLTS